MAGSTELSVHLTCWQLAKAVFIHIAHHVLITNLQVETINSLHYITKHDILWNREDSVTHIFTVRRVFICTQCLDKLKNIVTHHVEHVYRPEGMEVLPTHILILHVFVGDGVMPYLAILEHLLDVSWAKHQSIAFINDLLFIEHLHIEKICELLNHRERIGYSTSPHRIPYFVNLCFKFTCNHNF